MGSAPKLYLDSGDQALLVYPNGATKFSRHGKRMWSTSFTSRRLTLVSSRVDAENSVILTGWACPHRLGRPT